MRHVDLMGRIAGITALCCVLMTGLLALPTRAYADAAGDATEHLSDICLFAGSQRSQCEGCANSHGIWTAFGCIVVNANGIFSSLFSVFIGISGGIAFLLILFGGFQILISAGNPERMNEGKELEGSAVAGSLLIVFSVFLLRLIGYDILRIPGFTP